MQADVVVIPDDDLDEVVYLTTLTDGLPDGPLWFSDIDPGPVG
jgi:hypothetical protein